MAICSNCGAEGTRVRSRWNEKGAQLPDECPSCAPGSFEKFTVPSDKKIWMGFEANPNQYEKRYDSDGVFYLRKPEYRAEQEQRLSSETEDEKDARLRAEAKKRSERRTRPMDPDELLMAVRKAADYAQALEESGGTLN